MLLGVKMARLVVVGAGTLGRRGRARPEAARSAAIARAVRRWRRRSRRPWSTTA